MKKMAIVVSVLLALAMFAGCDATVQMDVGTESTTSTVINAQSDVEVESETTTTVAEWQQFFIDYEAWVDDYIAFMEKYQANPTDVTLLADYSELVAELAEWESKTGEFEASLEGTDDALTYMNELTRITEKLNAALA